MKKITWFMIFSLSLFIFTDAQSDVKQIKDNIVNTQYVKDIAIHIVNNYKAGTPVENKIIVQSVTFKSNPFQDKIENRVFAKIPELGQTLWTITGNQLPVTENNCLDADAPLCNEYKPHKSGRPRPVCYALCILMGPEFLAFDENLGRIYIGAGTGASGTGGGPWFIFVADIHTKKIKLFKLVHGPLSSYDVYLSPSGTYLALNDNGAIVMLNTRTGEEFAIVENVLTKGEKFVFLSQVKWLDDGTLKYLKGEYRDKFQHEPDVSIEKILDIRSRKTRNAS
jgi:hypothetical protein